MHDPTQAAPWLATEPAYPASPEPPPDTDGEYLVSLRRALWGPDRATTRRVFHTYAKATAHRAKLERQESSENANANDQVFVTIHWRPCRHWREIP